MQGRSNQARKASLRASGLERRSPPDGPVARRRPWALNRRNQRGRSPEPGRGVRTPHLSRNCSAISTFLTASPFRRANVSCSPVPHSSQAAGTGYLCLAPRDCSPSISVLSRSRSNQVCYTFDERGDPLLSRRFPRLMRRRNEIIVSSLEQRLPRGGGDAQFCRIGIILSQHEQSCAGWVRMLLPGLSRKRLNQRRFLLPPIRAFKKYSLSTTFAAWPVAVLLWSQKTHLCRNQCRCSKSDISRYAEERVGKGTKNRNERI